MLSKVGINCRSWVHVHGVAKFLITRVYQSLKAPIRIGCCPQAIVSEFKGRRL